MPYRLTENSTLWLKAFGSSGLDMLVIVVIEGDEVHLFLGARSIDLSRREVRGHQDVIDAGLVRQSNQTRGCSLGIKNSEILAVYRQSCLNDGEANFCLPKKCTDDILSLLPIRPSRTFRTYP